MFALKKYDDDQFASIMTQYIDDILDKDLKIIDTLPHNLINTIFNEDKFGGVNRYVKNLIILSKIDNESNKSNKSKQFVPEVDKITNYLSFDFDKPLRSDSMGQMMYDCLSAKINTHNLILKSANAKNQNKIINDYLIGQHLNSLSKLTNVFGKYHGMFKCSSHCINLWKTQGRLNEQRFFIVCEGYSFSNSSSHQFPDQRLSSPDRRLAWPDINLSEYLIKNRDITHDKLCMILVQILCGIHFAQEHLNFEHKNLTALNIMVHNIKPTKINYKIGDSYLTFTTDTVPIIHNFHASKIHKGILLNLSDALIKNTNSVTTPSNEFESAYWSNDKTKLVDLLSKLPAIIDAHRSLELYVDMIYGHNTEIINIINLAATANDFGIQVNEKPPTILPYNPLRDLNNLLLDLSKYAYVLSNDKSIELLKSINKKRTTYKSVLDCINDIINYHNKI